MPLNETVWKFPDPATPAPPKGWVVPSTDRPIPRKSVSAAVPWPCPIQLLKTRVVDVVSENPTLISPAEPPAVAALGAKKFMNASRMYTPMPVSTTRSGSAATVTLLILEVSASFHAEIEEMELRPRAGTIWLAVHVGNTVPVTTVLISGRGLRNLG